MAISASQVKDLREKTGVGMMECKKALTENDGDMEKAIVWLRERGMSRAQKKAGRTTAEGIVAFDVNADQTVGVVLEVNCETDFVSKNEDFQAFVAESAKLALQNKAGSVGDLESMTLASGTTVKDTLPQLIAKIGENLQLRRVEVVTAATGTVSGYSHMGGKIGSLVAIDGAQGPEAQAVAKDIAMHIAAASPRYLNSSEVDTAELEQEKAIARKALIEQGKPENMIEKILGGQMSKFYKEVCLVDQAFVKDPKTSISQVVSKLSDGAKVVGFKRFQLGEGIEKRADDFADEVAKLSK